MAELITEITRTTTSEYSGMSFDVLFDTVESATDLVSISDGSVYTGEAAVLTIDAIATDDSILNLFTSDVLNPFTTELQLLDFTSNTFTDFSATDIKGLRFTMTGDLSPSLTLPTGTNFVFTSVVPEPAAGMLLAAGFITVLVGRNLRRRLSRAPAR